MLGGSAIPFFSRVLLTLPDIKRLKLSREQKTVVKLGINGRLISPKEIFNNVGIVDTEKYRQIVESLTELGIFKREISRTGAYKLAGKKGISKKSIGIYKVTLPNVPEKIRKTEYIDEKDNSDYAKVFVRGVDWYATVSDVETTLSVFGDISEIIIPKNRDTGESRGFAFVEFETKGAAQKALTYEKSLFVRGRKIYIQDYKE